MRVAIPTLLLAACGPKTTTKAPVVGWAAEGESAMQCYHPPDYAAMGETDRKLARSKVLDEMKSQWLGKRGDGVSFDETRVDDLDTTLLGRPTQIEMVSQKNLEQCMQAAASGDTAAWATWIRNLPDQITEGECMTPFDYQMFDYLDIGTGWQRPIGVCAGNRVHIHATDKDRYQIVANGPFINADGDPDQPTTSGDWPCTAAGCFAGQLIGRFTSQAGVENVFPIGVDLEWTAMEHGTLEYRINDSTFYDNVWYTKGSMTDHTSIEVSPN